MKKTLVVLLALAMAISMVAVLPFAASADDEVPTTGAAPAVWSGKANIQWYLDALEEDPNAEVFHLNSAEDLAGLAYLVNAYSSADLKTCYNGLWYDTATGDVLGFSISGFEGGFCFNYGNLGFYIPATEDKFNKSNGQYIPEYDEEYENTIDGSAHSDGDDFKYKTIYLDTDVVLNVGSAADWETEAPANVWMPIGGGRSSDATFAGFNGTFMGGGHTVSGIYFSAPESAFFGIGLFGYVAKGTAVSVQDLIVENCCFVGGTTVAPLIGRTSDMVSLFNCHIKNCIVKVSNYAGGLVGSVHGGSLIVEQCSVIDVTVDANKAVGGLTGGLNFQGLSVTDCIISGSVTASTTPNDEGEPTNGWEAGIIVGRVAQGSISVSHAIANVALVEEGTEGFAESTSYSASAGAVYGSVAKRNATDKFSAPSPLLVEGFYYVNNIQSNGEIVDFPTATVVTESQILGKAPKANIFGFDFEEVWDYGANGELPVLRNAGKSTEEASGSGEDDPTDPGEGEHVHVFTPDTWVKEKKATCTAEGVKAHYHCTCGKDFASDKETELTDLSIPATGHNYGEWIEEVAATTEAAGTAGHYHCEACGKDFDKDKKEVADLTIAKLEKSGGCGGVIVGAPFIAVVVLGAAVLLRKKENEIK